MTEIADDFVYTCKCGETLTISRPTAEVQNLRVTHTGKPCPLFEQLARDMRDIARYAREEIDQHMTREHIRGVLACLAEEGFDKHVAFPPFCLAMRNREYGARDLELAWHWFRLGWEDGERTR